METELPGNLPGLTSESQGETQQFTGKQQGLREASCTRRVMLLPFSALSNVKFCRADLGTGTALAPLLSIPNSADAPWASYKCPLAQKADPSLVW